MNSWDENYLKDFHVLIQEKGQFWPKKNWRNQKQLIFQTNKSIEIGFKMISRKQIKYNRYVKDAIYSLTKCLKDFIAKEVGCALQWFQEEEHPICSKKEEIERTQELFVAIQEVPLTNLTVLTGCLHKCSRLKHEISVLSEKEISWE